MGIIYSSDYFFIIQLKTMTTTQCIICLDVIKETTNIDVCEGCKL